MTRDFFRDFKEFILRGNVTDLVIGFIVGVAFTALVKSLVNDIIMPPLGWLTGDRDFSRHEYVLKEATEGAEAIAIRYGRFFSDLIDFLLIALIVFVVIRFANRFERKRAAERGAPPKPSREVELLEDIKAILKEK